MKVEVPIFSSCHILLTLIKQIAQMYYTNCDLLPKGHINQKVLKITYSRGENFFSIDLFQLVPSKIEMLY